MERYFISILVSLPINIILIFCTYLSISKEIRERRNEKEKNKNLRSFDNLYVNVTENEKEMLDALTRFNGFKSNSQFIHSIIKQQKFDDIAV